MIVIAITMIINIKILLMTAILITVSIYKNDDKNNNIIGNDSDHDNNSINSNSSKINCRSIIIEKVIMLT